MPLSIGGPVGKRHGKGVNMFWADGHVEWKSQLELLNGLNGDLDWYYKRIKGRGKGWTF
jgi:prepilin-type processing-associated H-X9-DG protein